MKLKVMQSNLLPALTAATRAINRQAGLPVLENVLLDAQDDTVVLTTTNLEIAYRIPVPAKVERGGRVTVPAKTLLQIVKGGKDIVEIEAKDFDVVIKTGFVSRNIRGIDAEEFPHVDDVPDITTSLIVSAIELRDAINGVIKFAANNNVRPILTGAHLSSIDGKLVLTACDNFVIGTTRIGEFSVTKGEVGEYVIPAKNLAEVGKVLTKSRTGEVVNVSFGAKHQVSFEFDNGWRVVSRLIDSQYPRWDQVIPVGGSTKVEVPLDAMRELFGSVNGLRWVRLGFADGEISAHGKDGEDTFDASIPATVNGNLEEWAVDPDYMRKVLSSITGENMTIELNSRLAPALFYSGDMTRYVVMPTNVVS